MSDAQRRAKAEHIRHLLATEGDAVAENTRGFNRGRYEAVADLDGYEELKREARAIKEDAIADLPELIDELRASVEANGGTVYLADDADDAAGHVADVLAEADSVVKSKSMTTEEVDLNEALAAAGTTVTETDLGEFVLQIADEEPSHIVGPAIHKSRAEIAALFNDRFDPDPALETAPELTKFAREHLLERIREADAGVTGANFLTADSGTLALVTSEGNARKCAVTPPTHVAVAGVEKIVPSVEDLAPFVELLGKSGTGQDLTSYLSLLTPPVSSPPVDFDAPDDPIAGGKSSDEAADTDGTAAHPDREFHLVLVDNGRMAMREDDDLRETLYCVRCGACANSCGNFQSVGGHAFGGETYSGGIATGWEAGVEDLETAGEFNDLCTGCTRCVPACPVGIDVPWINTVVRDRLTRSGGDGDAFDHLAAGLSPDEEPEGLDPAKRLFGNFQTVARVGSATAPASNWLADRDLLRRLLDRYVGVAHDRALPDFARTTLVEWFGERGPAVDIAEATREAVLYPDLYTNHLGVERGKAAVRLLEALGTRVTVPRAPGSGRAPLSQGMVATARKRARDVRDALGPHLDADRDVVVLEPSALAAFHREYERLLDDDTAARIRANSYDVLEYAYGLLENGGGDDVLAEPDATGTDQVAYHRHCQARTLEVAEFSVATLERAGYDVAVTDTECCGMAGSFGYKSEYVELSRDVGEPIVEQVAGTDRRVLASGTSCIDHVGDLLGEGVDHPVELLAPDG